MLERQTNWNIMRKYIVKRDGLVCRACGAEVTLKRFQPNTLHIDHIVPIAKGGDMWDETNMQVLCGACNLSKGSKTMEEWEAQKAAAAERDRITAMITQEEQAMPLFEGGPNAL